VLEHTQIQWSDVIRDDAPEEIQAFRSDCHVMGIEPIVLVAEGNVVLAALVSHHDLGTLRTAQEKPGFVIDGIKDLLVLDSYRGPGTIKSAALHFELANRPGLKMTLALDPEQTRELRDSLDKIIARQDGD
jgi:hypothetical protein